MIYNFIRAKTRDMRHFNAEEEGAGVGGVTACARLVEDVCNSCTRGMQELWKALLTY